MGAELFHADGRTDRQTDITKLIVAVRNFVNVPKKDFIFAAKDVNFYVFLIEFHLYVAI